MGQVSAAKFLGGILLVAIPLVGTSYFARPTFANAINSKLVQEDIEKNRKHNYSSDGYNPSKSQDEIIKRYMKSGSGKARDFKPTTN
ncbi:hypothetical protein FOA43_000093 [Brettanomyces nanus]|uniref:Uncharacterized protein n=1 Tax=Eeniella nana TaxID=13502 RepID=A0A875RVC7_EENNA|nr:uncharacterized protein FOA43_000093 [Brettanomyces nanus]QPG72791.1 hypothetical protein FOA43_000093 [Brettanomyces nanus]